MKDEKQLKKIEELISYGVTSVELSREICRNNTNTVELLRKPEKTMPEFECKSFKKLTTLIELCMRDAELSFKTMDFGSLRYLGQVRLMQVQK